VVKLLPEEGAERCFFSFSPRVTPPFSPFQAEQKWSLPSLPPPFFELDGR